MSFSSMFGPMFGSYWFFVNFMSFYTSSFVVCRIGFSFDYDVRFRFLVVESFW